MVIGTAFGAVVSSFVTAFLDPLIALLTSNKNLQSAKFVELGKVWPYGLFVTAVISFLLMAAVVYFFVVVPVQKLMERFKTEPDTSPTPTRDCPYCLSSIPAAATRCAFCTADSPAAA